MHFLKVYENKEDFRTELQSMTKLCARGKAAAQRKYKVYPSAYANAYAAKVCRGEARDLRGRRQADKAYARRRSPSSGLRRWFAEEWVNVCEPPPYPPCGRAKASLRAKDYPYCRPLRRISPNTPKTVRELGKRKLAEMCRKKQRAERQSKSPTRVSLSPKLRKR